MRRERTATTLIGGGSNDTLNGEVGSDTLKWDSEDTINDPLPRKIKLAPLKDRIETLKTNLTEFKEGGHLTFAHDPAQGVAIDVNGTAGKTIQGDDFADALLSIWIGDELPNEEIKVGLLGGKCT